MSNKIFTYDEWFAFSDKFKERQKAGYSVTDCLRYFLVDAGIIESGGSLLPPDPILSPPKKDESLDLYFERKMKPVWDYVYQLNEENKKLRKRVDELERKSNILYQPLRPSFDPYSPTYPTQFKTIYSDSTNQVHCKNEG